jgi:hypothetical protein
LSFLPVDRAVDGLDLHDAAVDAGTLEEPHEIVVFAEPAAAATGWAQRVPPSTP